MLRRIVPAIGLLLFLIYSCYCFNTEFEIHQKGNLMAAGKIDEVLKQYAQAIMAIPGVVGVGQGLFGGKACIKVFVDKRTPDLDRKIAKTLEGYQVVLEETGPIKALPK